MLLFMTSLSLAQLTPDRFYYIGTLGSAPLQLELRLNNQHLHGLAIHSGKAWKLEGNWAYQGPARLNEVDLSGQSGGLWLASINTDSETYASTITGMYDQGDALAFSLRKVADYVQTQMVQSRINVRSSYPFFLEPAIFNEVVQRAALAAQMDFFAQGQQAELEGTMFNSWSLDSQYQIQYVSNTVLSLLVTEFAYTGGAHPNTHFQVINLELKDKELVELNLEDIFDTQAIAILQQYLSEQLAAQGAAWILDASVRLEPENLSLFTFSPLGLSFYFPPYSVGPYAQGSFTIEIPTQTLEALAIHSKLSSLGL